MKRINTNIKNYKLSNDNINIELLENGAIHRITSANIQINQIDGNYIDGSMMNIYLRKDEEYIKILGSKNTKLFSIGSKSAVWKGEGLGISYTLTLTLSSGGIWFWNLDVEGQAENVDVIFIQDLGLADVEALKSNEAYTSQYIDQNIVENPNFAILSRQNQDQSGENPFLGIGTNEKIVGYATDGYDFFGTNYKTDSIVKGLQDEVLANRIYQYEMTVSALQTDKFDLVGEKSMEFYTIYKSNHPKKIEGFEFADQVEKAREKVSLFDEKLKNIDLIFGREVKTLNGIEFTDSEIEAIYESRELEEFNDDELYSFFTERNSHVVLKRKEKIVKRSHGHILMSNKELSVKTDILTSTNYMNGVFQAQTVIGNTSHNKFLSSVRNSLNIFKKTGQRIYIIRDGELNILGTPSIYEMGFNYSKWLYKFEEDVIEVLVYSHYNNPIITLEMKSQQNKKYNFFVTHDVVMNDVENDVDFILNKENGLYKFTSSDSALNKKKVPGLEYTIEVFENHEIYDESYITNKKETKNSIFGIELKDISSFKINYSGKTGKEIISSELAEFEKNRIEFEKHYEEMLNDFKIENKDSLEITKFNTIMRWYTHDMLVHYLVPHGLEQYEGAAWGTRDVCQGPAEYFLANQQYDVVREIIEIVYSHQFLENGNWPQWFMFDEYSEITASESHGDIIIWPLKMLADYLNYTDDLSILDDKVPYVSLRDMKKTETEATIYEHLKKQIQYIKNNFIKGTYLSTYADGDWDDTLQPHDSSLRDNMASTWTVALTYQSLTKLSKELSEYNQSFSNEIREIANNIKEDFEKYFYNDDALPGFILMKEDGKVEFIIHPDEEHTDIDYRLLPMTRSIISELFDKDNLEKHLEIIKNNLLYPDGARLMSKPAMYDGGVSRIFERAEQAANFGREIGLQYVHAHIRYVESMTKIGKANEAWEGLQTVNPILISEYVKNANTRQSNAYFSSSDGNFINRYDAKENYDLLKSGTVNVNGGWRIYSSGPGIYINQLISNLLGIRVKKHTIEIDPLIPEELDNLEVSLKIDNKPIKIVLTNNGKKDSLIINGEKLEGLKLKNKYREGGIEINRKLLVDKLNETKNRIEY